MNQAADAADPAVWAATAFWAILALWAGVGLIVWILLLAGGYRRFDLAAAEASLPAKLILLPGTLALWPVMLRRLAGAKPREDRAPPAAHPGGPS